MDVIIITQGNDPVVALVDTIDGLPEELMFEVVDEEDSLSLIRGNVENQEQLKRIFAAVMGVHGFVLKPPEHPGISLEENVSIEEEIKIT